MTLKEKKCVQVYVEVTLTDHADYFLLRINDCWATQYPHPNSTEGSVHHLLLNGFDHLSISKSFLIKRWTQQIPSLLLLSISSSGVWTIKRSSFLMWVRDSLGVMERAPLFATVSTCFALQPNHTNSICTARYSCVIERNSCPAHLWVPSS